MATEKLIWLILVLWLIIGPDKMNKFKKFYIVLLITCYWLLITATAQAARLYFESQEATVGTSGEFSVGVNIDADERVNAFSVAVSISGPLIPFDINEANSVINFWVEKPNWDKTTRLLTFSGITPGGFQGEKGRLLVIKFKTEGEEGNAVLGFDKKKTKVYLHTADGAEDSLELTELHLPIIKGKENIPVAIFDNDPPEAFIPEISQDPSIFDNKYFLVFATQDKGSGIDHYEVCEGNKTKCAIAESPYFLQNQKLDQKIFVKAIDKNGNEKMATVEPRYPMKWYKFWWIWGIIILGIVAVFITKKFK